ncbi:MAG: Ig-like domain-containing protein [Chitinophagaceae bacterium]|nr:Ig-like domain-containing protein [Chitinophagaceae bacterium]
MRFSKIIPYGFISAVIVVNLLSSSGCANIVPPAGGPRDSLPPVAVSTSPKDSALGVTTQRININFNEFVELKNANEKILISPYPVKQPITEAKLRTVTVRLKDSLLPNTTYTIDFGNSIVDLNEGNVLKSFRYVFSTGTVIDSNELKGRIINAENGKTDSTFFALLYRKQEDSTVAKEKPIYVARVDNKGYFHFTNLPTGTFYLYGLQDADGDKKYSQPAEAFAFLDSAVQINAFTKSVQLYAFAAEKEKERKPASSAPSGKPNTVKRLTYTSNLEAGAQDLLDSLEFTYQKPLKQADTTQIKLFKDSATAVTDVKIINDTANKKLILFTKWKEGGNYRLIFQKEYASDTGGLKPNKEDTISFRVKAEKEYGSIRLRFKNIDLKKNPVLLLYANDKLESSYPLAAAEWYRKLYKPGEYQVRILYDDNKNGVWDAGNFFSKPRKQPELVQNLDVKILIKPNWDNEQVIDIGK